MRKLPIFLVLTVLLASFLTQFSFGQTEDIYVVSVSASEVMRLRGQTVNLITVTNASSFRQVILSPNNATLYDQIRTSNMTFTVPTNAEYGTYTVKSIAGSSIAETWLTVLDITGWQSTTFPYSHSWQNVNYTFFGNGTIRATDSMDRLEIDLSTLRSLATQYGLTVAPSFNSMNFRVRFSKALIIVDLTFSFIHTGCKFTVNGTLDQARIFSFDIVNPQRLRKALDSIRQGNLVFDFGDLRKAQQAFSYEDGVLMVNVPQSFVLDPTIFSDGFESGNLSAWTGTNISGGTIAASTTQKHHGSYSAKAILTANSQWAVVYKDLTAATTIYERYYFWLDSYTFADGAYLGFEEILNAWNIVGRFGLYRSGANIRWALSYGDGAGAETWVAHGSEGPTLQTWYCIEIGAYANTSSGWTQLWVDGVSKISNTAKNTGSAINRIDVGAGDAPGSSYATCYSDCVVVDSAYIGPEVTAQNYIADLSQSTSTTWNCLIKSNFNVVTSKSVTSTWNMLPEWNALVTLSRSISTTWNILVQSNFNIVTSLSTTFSWLTATTLGICYTVDLTLSVVSSWLIQIQWNALTTLGQSFTTTWGVLTQTNFNIITSLSSTFTLAVDLISGLQYTVDLSIGIITSWAVNAIQNLISPLSPEEAAAIGIIFAVVVLAVCVGLIYTRRRQEE